MVIVYTIAGVLGFLASSVAGYLFGALPLFLRGANLTLGASAPIFGLLGALVYYGRRGGSSMVHREAMGYAVMLFVMGLIMPGIDNYAHAGGFAGGYLAGKWLDPLKPERMDHLIGAAISILLTALAIIASIATALPLILEIGRAG
jgi:rhomboid protease GluP